MPLSTRCRSCSEASQPRSCRRNSSPRGETALFDVDRGSRDRKQGAGKKTSAISITLRSPPTTTSIRRSGGSGVALRCRSWPRSGGSERSRGRTEAFPRRMVDVPAETFASSCSRAQALRPRPETRPAALSIRSNRSIRNPNAMTAIAVRTQARNVRSFAAWSRKLRITSFRPRYGDGQTSGPDPSSVVM